MFNILTLVQINPSFIDSIYSRMRRIYSAAFDDLISQLYQVQVMSDEKPIFKI